jgi:hypothetical protein
MASSKANNRVLIFIRIFNTFSFWRAKVVISFNLYKHFGVKIIKRPQGAHISFYPQSMGIAKLGWGFPHKISELFGGLK